MAFEAPIAIGSLNWGGPVNNSLLDLDSRINDLQEAQPASPAEQNVIAWTWDPATTITGSIPTTGTVNMAKIWIRQPALINNVALTVVTAGVTLTAGQNFAGLYDSLGNQVGVTVDQTVAWGTTGLKDMPLTVPYNAAVGAYYVTFVANGTTAPSFGRGSSLAAGGATVNIGLTAVDARYATGPVAQTSLPASIVMAARTIDTRAWWAAVK